jgi:hypothetical protein
VVAEHEPVRHAAGLAGPEDEERAGADHDVLVAVGVHVADGAGGDPVVEAERRGRLERRVDRRDELVLVHAEHEVEARAEDLEVAVAVQIR